MGKRSNFKKRVADSYLTKDFKAAKTLTAYFLKNKEFKVTYYEPCEGEGDLIDQLAMFECKGSSDIASGKDALDLTEEDLSSCGYIITNPPWSRHLLHPMIDHFRTLRPTWLLFDANWMHTKQAKPYLEYCHTIISVGRMCWFPETKTQGKDDCCWYGFGMKPTSTTFVTI